MKVTKVPLTAPSATTATTIALGQFAFGVLSGNLYGRTDGGDVIGIRVSDGVMFVPHHPAVEVEGQRWKIKEIILEPVS